jgi:hypothetical protein
VLLDPLILSWPFWAPFILSWKVLKPIYLSLKGSDTYLYFNESFWTHWVSSLMGIWNIFLDNIVLSVQITYFFVPRSRMEGALPPRFL